ncbi:MAG TPA: divalent-cation tolerance protein CutA [Chthoniobacterales bacterium]|nr:divalent-cation tolerance protein CutA [Chthoniobacterales bacterium]
MFTSPSNLKLILTSFADEKTAVDVIRCLVKEHLAACGTLIPNALSIYSWQEKIEETKEVVVLIKTPQSLAERCMKRLAELHPYEVPEIITMEPSSVGTSYLDWVVKTCLV